MPELVAVPNVDGVPDVAFAPGYAAGLALATADTAVGLLSFAGASRWGLYLGGRSVIEADTIIAFDHKQEWVLADYPLERGAFESYDKVQIPYDVRLIFVAGGSEANRGGLLASVAAIAGDLNLYDAVMPEKIFSRLNVIHYDFRRTAQNGVGLLSVALWCQEVRETTSTAGASNPSATGGIGDTASPSGADPVNGGTVQARDPTSTELSAVGTQDFSGGYNVSGYNANPTYSADVGEAVFTDPSTGQEVGRVPGGSALPQTSSTISGLPPAGPDQFSNLNIGTGGLS